jgi:moderate conductance mechanosensitive channel
VNWITSGIVWLQANWVDIVLRAGAAALLFAGALVAGSVLGRWAERTLRSRRGRAHTLAATLRTLVKLAAALFGAVVALEQLGVNLGAMLAGAGIIGLAIGFGAQSLVKDVIAGFFLIFDGALDEGDYVEIGETIGVVEEIGLRMTKLRSDDGQLWYIQNGEIRSVGNFSRGPESEDAASKAAARAAAKRAAPSEPEPDEALETIADNTVGASR